MSNYCKECFERQEKIDCLGQENTELYEKNVQLQEENEKLKANKGRCAFKCLDNTFCDEAKIKIDKLELDKDCLNASLETARKYRGIAEVDRNKYKQALEEIREMLKIADKTKKAEVHFEYMDKALVKANEVLNDRD